MEDTPPATSDGFRDELSRRHSNTVKVLALFKASPLVWISATELMQAGGAMAWRTRVSDARKIVRAEGGAIENRQRNVRVGNADDAPLVVSEYRYVPRAPDAFATLVPFAQQELFG